MTTDTPTVYVPLAELDIDAALDAMAAAGVPARHIDTMRLLRVWLYRFEFASLGAASCEPGSGYRALDGSVISGPVEAQCIQLTAEWTIAT